MKIEFQKCMGQTITLIHVSALYHSLIPGYGVHPDSDPWGRKFSAEYEPARFKKRGTRICGPFFAALDGIQGDADFIAHMFHLRRPMDIQNSFVISDFVFEISLTFANSCLICLVLIHQLRKLQAYWMLLSLWCIGSGSWWWWWKTAIHSLGCWCPLPPKAPCLHILQTTRIHGAHGMMSIQCPARLTTVDEFVDECASSPICDVVGFDSWRTIVYIIFFDVWRFVYYIYFFFCSSTAGIYPDLLHICDLALYLDLYGSAFILWTEGQQIFPESSRDARLLALYKDYLNWCIRNRSLLPCLVLSFFVMYLSSLI